MFKRIRQKRALKEGRGYFVVKEYDCSIAGFWFNRRFKYGEKIYSMTFVSEKDSFLVNNFGKPVNFADDINNMIYPSLWLKDNLKKFFPEGYRVEHHVEGWIYRKK